MTNTHRIGRIVIAMLAIGALVAPAASARFSETQGAPPIVVATPQPLSEVAATRGYDFGRVPATVTIVSQPSSGFDWGDAGIGAGVALALIALGGGALMLSRQHANAHTRVGRLT